MVNLMKWRIAFFVNLLGLFFIVILFFANITDVAEPIENEIPTDEFYITSRNTLGNGNFWVYGKDKQFYYYSGLREASDYIKISKNTVDSCQGFDEFDVLTWLKCGVELPQDCQFVEDAKFAYVEYSSATKNSQRYIKSPENTYGCSF